MKINEILSYICLLSRTKKDCEMLIATEKDLIEKINCDLNIPPEEILKYINESVESGLVRKRGTFLMVKIDRHTGKKYTKEYIKPRYDEVFFAGTAEMDKL